MAKSVRIKWYNPQGKERQSAKYKTYTEARQAIEEIKKHNAKLHPDLHVPDYWIDGERKGAL